MTRILAVAAILIAALAPASADDYPTRPIRVYTTSSAAA